MGSNEERLRQEIDNNLAQIDQATDLEAIRDAANARLAQLTEAAKADAGGTTPTTAPDDTDTPTPPASSEATPLLNSATETDRFYTRVGEGDDTTATLGRLVVDGDGYVKFEATAATQEDTASA